ncbi:MAG: ABC transporter permease [Nitrospirae bacterium]|nr:ABC transporter permease [Nitrospirota bacterium]
MEAIRETLSEALSVKSAITVLVAAIVLSSVFSAYLTPYDPTAIDLDSVKSGPSVKHPFGTDSKGRDILSRVLYGGRLSLGVSLLASITSLVIGLSMGLTAGYFSSRPGKLAWVDTAIMALVDLTLSFPSLLLSIGISVLLPPGALTVIVAISLVGWASFTRLIRGEVLKIREALYVYAARSIGATHYRIVVYHILPQCLSIGKAMIGIKFGSYILTEASLSFLGLGPQPPSPSWGNMISENRAYILTDPWMVIFPGLAIAVTILAFNIVGDIYRQNYGIEGGMKG